MATYTIYGQESGFSTVSETASGTIAPNLNAVGADTLSLSEVASAFATYFVSASDTITVSEDGTGEIDLPYVEAFASDTISITEDGDGNIYESIQTAFAEDELTVTEDASGLQFKVSQAQDTISVLEPVIDPVTYEVTYVETVITETASAAIIPGVHYVPTIATDSITITEQTSVNSILNASATDSVIVTEGVLHSVDEACRCCYDESTFGPYPSQFTFSVGIDEGFALIYPAAGTATDSFVITSRSPNLGNKHRIAPQRIIRNTRGGDLIVFRDPMWPQTETLTFQFSNLSMDEALGLQQFIENHIGQEFLLVDHERRAWVGTTPNVDDPIVQDRGGTRGRFTYSFTFEGTLQ